MKSARVYEVTRLKRELGLVALGHKRRKIRSLGFRLVT